MDTRSLHRAFPIILVAAFAAIAVAFAFGVQTALAAQQASGNGTSHVYAAAGEELITVDQGNSTVSEAPAAKPTVTVRAKVKKKGWLAAVAAGKTAGTKTKKYLRSFKVFLSNPTGLSGHIKYRTYDKGKGWGKTAMDGKATGRASRDVQAVKIWLTGKLSKQYSVKYRVYMKGKGWLSWVTDKQVAGIKKGSWNVSAVQVKLVTKGVDETKTQLDGIDIASWQAGLDPAKVEADFIIVKATEGTWYTNPYFRKWADATLACGKLLGAYHFVRKGDAVKQADYFVDTVGDYVGKCALFLDWENAYGVDAMAQGTKWAKKFLDRVYQRTGVKPLIYMSKDVTRQYDWSSVAGEYGLWVAQYLYKYYTNGSGYIDNPDSDSKGYGAWSAPTIYQYNSKGQISGYSGNLDINKFYGSAADWRALQQKVA